MPWAVVVIWESPSELCKTDYPQQVLKFSYPFSMIPRSKLLPKWDFFIIKKCKNPNLLSPKLIPV